MRQPAHPSLGEAAGQQVSRREASDGVDVPLPALPQAVHVADAQRHELRVRVRVHWNGDAVKGKHLYLAGAGVVRQSRQLSTHRGTTLVMTSTSWYSRQKAAGQQ
jgi:hypothetical protein